MRRCARTYEQELYSQHLGEEIFNAMGLDSVAPESGHQDKKLLQSRAHLRARNLKLRTLGR